MIRIFYFLALIVLIFSCSTDNENNTLCPLPFNSGAFPSCEDIPRRKSFFIKFPNIESSQEVFLEFKEKEAENFDNAISYTVTTNDFKSFEIINECLRCYEFPARLPQGQNGYWNEVYEGKKLKPNTAYDLFMSKKCDGINQVGERKMIMQDNTPPCNNSEIIELVIADNNIIIKYKFDGFNSVCPFNFGQYKSINIWHEIEYGKEGFVNGQGTIINRTPEEDKILLIPLSELDIDTVYEFTVRAKCNNISFGEYSQRMKITTPN